MKRLKMHRKRRITSADQKKEKKEGVDKLAEKGGTSAKQKEEKEKEEDK